jgi:DNA-directed RNA polymerase sigma subunit (sigma70/sigma32)
MSSFFKDEELTRDETEIFIQALIENHGKRFTCDEIGNLTGLSRQRIHKLLQLTLEKVARKLKGRKVELFELLETESSFTVTRDAKKGHAE